MSGNVSKRSSGEWEYRFDIEPDPLTGKRRPSPSGTPNGPAHSPDVRGDRFYAPWLLVATTGLRRGELTGLTRNDIDLESHRVHPSTPRVVVAGRTVGSEAKTRSGVRSLALEPDTYQALVEYLMSGKRGATCSARAPNSSLRDLAAPTAP